MRSILGMTAFVGLVATLAAPASAQFGGAVTVLADPANLPNWAAQGANMAKTIADDLARYQQLTREIAQADQELKQASQLNFNSQSALNAFLRIQQSVPATVGGAAMATAILNGQNGALSSGTLGGLTGEMLAAQGNLRGQASLFDADMAMLVQMQHSLAFEAAQAVQQQAWIDEADQRNQAMMDLNSPDTTVGFYY